MRTSVIAKVISPLLSDPPSHWHDNRQALFFPLPTWLSHMDLHVHVRSISRRASATSAHDFALMRASPHSPRENHCAFYDSLSLFNMFRTLRTRALSSSSTRRTTHFHVIVISRRMSSCTVYWSRKTLARGQTATGECGEICIVITMTFVSSLCVYNWRLT